MDNEPDFDLSPLVQAAASIHEMYLALVEAGFNEAQALALVVNLLTSGR